MADSRADFPAFLSNVVGRRFGLRERPKEDWGRCPVTGRPHKHYLVNCGACGKRRPS